MTTWTTPATWSVGESPTAAKLNTHIRDNLTWLHDDVPTCSLLATSAQTISNGTWTPVNFDDETIDNDSMHSGGTLDRITIQTSGRYQLWGTGAFLASANTDLGVRFSATISASPFTLGRTFVQGANQDGTGPTSVFAITMNAGDYVSLEVYQASGGTLNTYHGADGIRFGVTRL